MPISIICWFRHSKRFWECLWRIIIRAGQPRGRPTALLSARPPPPVRCAAGRTPQCRGPAGRAARGTAPRAATQQGGPATAPGPAAAGAVLVQRAARCCGGGGQESEKAGKAQGRAEHRNCMSLLASVWNSALVSVLLLWFGTAQFTSAVCTAQLGFSFPHCKRSATCLGAGGG